MNKKKRVMIAGGGTGGHIYPAIAIGRSLVGLDSTCDVRYVGTKQGLEQKIMAQENLTLDLIQSGKLNFSGQPLKKIRTLFSIVFGFFESITLIRKHKPDFVLGVGGYASAPFLLAASLMKVKSAVWEPNAHPGMANRLLSRFVKKAYLVFAEAKNDLHGKDFKIVGMPLRQEMEQARSAQKKIGSNKLRLLCFGGSQGSIFLNKQISDLLISSPELHDKIEVVHQTGTADFQNMKTKYQGLTCVEVHEFIYNMPEYYQKSDVQFCRGGASTIAEAACFGVIPIVVPLPAADDHQRKNAEVLVQKAAGFMMLQNVFELSELKKNIILLMTDLKIREIMVFNLKSLATEKAAESIAADILKEINNKL